MRALLDITFPMQPFNAAVKNGTVGKKMKKILDAIKPEAIYFTEQDGHRGAIAVIKIDDVSEVPALAEPWFLTFDATVKIRIAMTPPDLQKAGLEALGKKWG